MIQVVYDRRETKITIKGHAHSGEIGHDLVCASASILAYTLASFIKNTYKARQVKKPMLRLCEGDAVIACRPRKRYRGAIILVVDAMCGGFELLARNYPDHVSYEILT